MARKIGAYVNGVYSVNSDGTQIGGQCYYVEGPNSSSGAVNWAITLTGLSTVLTVNTDIAGQIASGVNTLLSTSYTGSDVALFGGLSILP